MNFNEQLRQQRETAKLTPGEAANKLGLSEMNYEDCENGIEDLSIPERIGMLVGLGMDVETALEAAKHPDLHKLSDFGAMSFPVLIRETDDEFIVINRSADGMEYEIGKERVTTPSDALAWIDQMAGKNWVTRRHIRKLVAHFAKHLGLKIHPI